MCGWPPCGGSWAGGNGCSAKGCGWSAKGLPGCCSITVPPGRPAATGPCRHASGRSENWQGGHRCQRLNAASPYLTLAVDETPGSLAVPGQTKRAGPRERASRTSWPTKTGCPCCCCAASCAGTCRRSVHLDRPSEPYSVRGTDFVPKIRGRAIPQHSAIVRHPKGWTSRNRRRTRLLTVDLTGRTCAAEPQPDTSPPPGPPPRRFSQVGLRLLRLRLAVTSLLRLRLPATRLLRLRLDIPPAPIPPPPNTRALARADAHACTHAPALGPSG